MWCPPDLVLLGKTGRTRRAADLRTRSKRLESPLGGVRERPNRTVSKTVVPHGHRGFKSHLLRSRAKEARRIRGECDEDNSGRARPPAGSVWSSRDRKGVNGGTRTFDIRKTAARPGQEGPGEGQGRGSPDAARGQSGRGRRGERRPDR